MRVQSGLAPILIVVLVAILGVGGYFLYTSLRANPAKPESVAIYPTPVSVSTPTPKPESTSSADMANWKTYANSKYNFSFKYPGSWLYGELYKQEVVYPMLRVYLKPKTLSSTGDPTFGLINISIYNLRIHGYKTIDDFIKSYCSGFENQDPNCKFQKEAKDITVAGSPAKLLINVPLPANNRTVVVQKNVNIFAIQILLDKTSEKEYSLADKLEIFNQILSTFKFTN